MLPKLESHRGSSMEISSGTRVDIRKSLKRNTGGRSRETGEERPLKQPDTSAHAWMTWNDTQGET